MATAALSQKTNSEKASSLLYEPLNFVLVRTPLLPIQAFFDLADEYRQLALLSNPQVMRALAIGSSSLVGAMERFRRSGLTQRDAARMRSKLLRYQIRMSTRPTPFGMFAGVALAHWGCETDLRLLSSCYGPRSRPAMPALMNFVFSAEENPVIRKCSRVFANPQASIVRDRVTLPEPAPTKQAVSHTPVSVRATGVVQRILAAARTPVLYADLVQEICQSTPAATPEKVEKLLDELWRQTFLLTDLRPPLTTASPARYVADRLAAIPEAAELHQKIEKFLDNLEAWDSLDPVEGPATLPPLGEVPKEEHDNASDVASVQVDMAARLEGRLSTPIASEAARAAELLLRLSPSPRGLSSLAAYRQAYINRYGPERKIPLLELLDEQRGLGPVSKYGHSYVGPDSAKSALRSQTLLRLACTALYRRQRVLELDEKIITSLETWSSSARTAPVSLDLNFFVAAQSAEEIDRGQFSLVIGPNLGAVAAGRNLGRFADLIGPSALTALAEVVAREEEHYPECICAELVWLPQNFRSANVVIRPSVRAYEIVFGTSSGVPASHIIPLDDLEVGIDDGRFAVWWRSAGKRVIARAGHMLNHYSAPAAARFLLDLSHDGNAVFSSFDWGPAEAFPFLPRVQVGRTVLRPAQWRITQHDGATASLNSLDAWRAAWDVPRYVCLSVGDNRLILDLDCPAQAAELAVECKGLASGSAIIIQEMLPSFEDTWLSGPDGLYYSEFIASFMLRHTEHKTNAAVSVRTNSRETSECSPEPAVQRVHPPGGEWLFLKLYGAREAEDELIAESLLPFADQVIVAGLAEAWFFIRYSDPDPHLRVRFHGLPEKLNAVLFGQLGDWVAGLLEDGLANKFVFDTYEQEIERFGGFEAMSIAEKLFHIDSRSAALLLRSSISGDREEEKTTLLAISIDDLLRGLGLQREDRLAWYRKHAILGGPDVGADYRKRKDNLRMLLGDSSALRRHPGGQEIESILIERRAALADVGNRYRELNLNGRTSVPLDLLYNSFVHLHVNRLGGAGVSEQNILSLLLRAHESLEKAPIAR